MNVENCAGVVCETVASRIRAFSSPNVFGVDVIVFLLTLVWNPSPIILFSLPH